MSEIKRPYKKCLVHICCAPCSVYPIKTLGNEHFFLTGYFYRNNIHPLKECIKREENVRQYAESMNIPLVISKEYDIEGFIRNIAFREADRCRICYYLRLKSAGLIAKKGKFDYFTTTLLYSKFQKHEIIAEIGKAVGKEVEVPFYYRDFRCGWKEGIEESKKIGMYRQQYCGCIYSEKERYIKEI